MQKVKKASKDSEMRPYYDFSDGVRGKYAERYKKGVNIVVLEPDVAKEFPNSRAVNKALRGLLKKAAR